MDARTPEQLSSLLDRQLGQISALQAAIAVLIELHPQREEVVRRWFAQTDTILDVLIATSTPEQVLEGIRWVRASTLADRSPPPPPAHTGSAE